MEAKVGGNIYIIDEQFVIEKDTKMINYTKLCKSMTGCDKLFRDICRRDIQILKIILEHEGSRILSNYESLSKVFDIDTIVDRVWRNTKISISTYTNFEIFKYINTGGSKLCQIISGTYGPPYLYDRVMMKCLKFNRKNNTRKSFSIINKRIGK